MTYSGLKIIAMLALCFALRNGATRCNAAEQHIPDTLFRVAEARYNALEGLWQVNTNGFCPGDTLRVANLIPHPGTLFQAGCCGTTEGWYDTLTGLHLVVPADTSLEESYSILFGADESTPSPQPTVVASGHKVVGAWRFSRTVELRLNGDQVRYKLVDSNGSSPWLLYSKPLLINRSCLLQTYNLTSGKLASLPATLQLIRIDDFERISATPDPEPLASPDALFRLVDGDTTSGTSWKTAKTTLLFNPGVERKANAISFWLGESGEKKLPRQIVVETSSDNQNWIQIARVLPMKEAQQTGRLWCSFEQEIRFRYLRITFTTKNLPLIIREIKVAFVP
ncbi:MAG: hypothetical protein PHU33_11465 [Bacteroidales bacterium]|nr:hypothetical protein [Bacteroidales bacterium]